jgi:hypothetical protein
VCADGDKSIGRSIKKNDYWIHVVIQTYKWNARFEVVIWRDWEFLSPGMSRCVVGQVVQDVVRDCIAVDGQVDGD